MYCVMSVIISTPSGVVITKKWKITREDDEVREGRARVEEEDAGDEQRQREAALAPVEAGRDERPDLVEDHGHREEERREQRELERRHERRDDRSRDQAGAFGQLARSGAEIQVKMSLAK